MIVDLLTPPEAWAAAEEEINFWQEEKNREERLQWRRLNGY